MSPAAVIFWPAVPVLAAGIVLAWAQTWLADRYEVTWKTPGRLRACRRWYGTGAVVRDRAGAPGALFRVLDWCAQGTDVPWLLLEEVAGDGGGALWAPVTAFAPAFARYFRPRLHGCRLRLFADRPLPAAAVPASAAWRDAR